MSIPKKSLHTSFSKSRKMTMQNDRPNKGKQGRESIFSTSFKVQIALEYLNGDYSCAQIAKKYELSSHSVEYFVFWYRKNHRDMAPEEIPDFADSSSSPKDIKELTKKLSLAEMKIAALEKVIAIANEEYRTDLKKKASTR